jgi:hypothetical protein
VGARQKLDAAYLNGCLLVWGLVGLVAQSRTLSWLALVVTVVACCHSGEIGHRPDSGRVGGGR